jgi:hypothetical protein
VRVRALYLSSSARAHMGKYVKYIRVDRKHACGDGKMVVLRSVMHASGISDQRINISKYLRPDILVLDLEDSARVHAP